MEKEGHKTGGPFLAPGLETIYRYQIPKIKRSYPWMEVYVAVVASVSVFCGGFLQSYASFGIYSTDSEESDGESNGTLNLADSSWIASSPSLAVILGIIASAPLLEYCGRQKALIVSMVPFLFGWFLVFFSQNVVMIQAGRAFIQLCMGISKAVVPIYVSEISRATCRGAVGLVPFMTGTLGILLGVGIGCLLSDWRKLAMIVAISPVIFVLLLPYLPESPLWLLQHNQGERALKSLEQLRGDQEHKMRVQDELDDMKTSIEESNFSLRNLSWKSLLWRKENLMSCSLLIFQQFSGISVWGYYLAMIVSESGATDAEGGRIALSVSIVHFVAFFVSLSLIDRAGRRVLLIVSAILMAVTHSTLATFLYINNCHPNGTFIRLTESWLPLTALYFFIVAFSIGFGPIPFVFMTEVFSFKLRSYLCSVATLLAQIGSFYTLQLFPTLLHHFGQQVIFLLFVVHAIVCMFASVFVYRFIPETKGKTLAEIESFFRGPATTLFEDDGEHASYERLEMPLVYVPVERPVTPNPHSFRNVTTIYCKSPAAL